MKVIRDSIKKEITKDKDIALFPANAIAKRLAKTTKSISVDEEFIEYLLHISKDNRYAFPVLAILFPNLDYKNRNFHLDHCHPLSHFNKKKLKERGLPSNVEDKEYYEDPYFYNSVLNLQMLDENENISKNDKELKKWVKANSIDQRKHYLPDNLEFENFPSFIEDRKKLLKKALLKELTL